MNETVQYGDKLPSPSSAVKQAGASRSSNDQGYQGDRHPHFPRSFPAGPSIMNPVKLSCGLLHHDFLKIPPPTLVKGLTPLRKGKATFMHVHTDTHTHTHGSNVDFSTSCRHDLRQEERKMCEGDKRP